MQLFRGLIVIAMLSSNLAAVNTSQNLTHQISQQYVNVINKNNEALNISSFTSSNKQLLVFILFRDSYLQKNCHLLLA